MPDPVFLRRINENIQAVIPVLQNVIAASSDDQTGGFFREFPYYIKLCGNDPVRQVCVSGAQICVKLISDFISGICFFYQFPVYPQFLHNFIDQISVIEFNSQRVGDHPADIRSPASVFTAQCYYKMAHLSFSFLYMMVLQ